MLLSICIPSYNRGHKAVCLVKHCLNMGYEKGEIEIICSNNGSEKNVEGYQELKELEDERFRYHEFAENQGFAANVSQVIKMAKGSFCMLLSDEDTILGCNLQNYMDFLKLHPELSLVKCCTSLVYADLKTCYVDSGEKALDQFYMMGNYISGTIYNRSVITDELLAEYACRYEKNVGYNYYIHLFLDAYALLHGNFCSGDLLLIEEGVPADTFAATDNTPDKTVPLYATYDSRLEQMHGFLEQIRNLDIDYTIQFQMFIRVLERITEQIYIQKEAYIRHGDDWNAIMKLVADRIKGELAYLNLPFSQEDEEIVRDYIDAITVKKK